MAISRHLLASAMHDADPWFYKDRDGVKHKDWWKDCNEEHRGRYLDLADKYADIYDERLM